jgi:hypothetical protein
LIGFKSCTFWGTSKACPLPDSYVRVRTFALASGKLPDASLRPEFTPQINDNASITGRLLAAR